MRPSYKISCIPIEKPIFPQANVINWVQNVNIPKVMRACADILSMLWIWVCYVWYLQVLGFGLPWEVIHRRRRCKRLASLSFCVLQPQDHRRNRSSTGLKRILASGVLFFAHLNWTDLHFFLLWPNQEIHSKQKIGSTEDTPRRGPESLPVGHHDIITDIATFQTTQGFIVTSSRDGIVKVWKWEKHCAKMGHR